MDNKLFDDFIKKQFDGYKPAVGSHIWENIAGKKDRKKPLGFWFSTAGKVAAIFVAVVLCSSVGFYFYNKKNTTPKNIVRTEKNEEIKNKEIEKQPLNTNKETTIVKNSKVHLGQNNSSSKMVHLPVNATIAQINDDASTSINKGKFIQTNSKIKITNSTQLEESLSGIEDSKNWLTAKVLEEKIIVEHKLSASKINFIKTPTAPFIPCPEAEKDAAGNKKYLEIYGGPDYISHSYSDTGDAYIAQRKASTGIHYAYSAGLRFTKVFGSGLSIRTGINYSQINERFSAFNGYLLERIVRVNSIGDTISNYTSATIQYKKSTNIYRTIDIPLQAGFEFGNGKWHTNLSAGAIINIFSKQTGSVVEPNGNVIDVSSGKASSAYQFKSNIGVSFLGSMSVYYKVNDRLHIMAEPYIRYSLSTATKPEITFKQKFHAAGLRLGLRWDF
jgi:hypothetical protein